MTQPTLWDAMEKAKAGMAAAADHADAVVAGWTDIAFDALCLAVRSFGAAEFTVEDLRSKVEYDIPSPPDRRAWGSVTRRAITEGVIVKTGAYSAAISSNGSPKMTYRAGLNT